MNSRATRYMGLAIFAALSFALSTRLPGQSDAEQRTPDQVALAAARAAGDPAARAAALRRFEHDFPQSSLHARATSLLFDTYLASFPDQTADIRALANAQIASALPGFERWVEQSRIADLLASAGTNGVDLEDAARWARNSVDSLTEEAYRREMTAAQLRYKLPRLTPRQLHADWNGYRASFLAALANVDLRQAKLDDADHALTEAYRLQPLSSPVNCLLGQLALARHQDRTALEDFQRAEATGYLDQRWREAALQLYSKLDHGDEAAFEQRVDTLYSQIYPAVFTLPKRELPTGGHTVLLELFTGSGCQPCAGPDLALDSLLHSYGPHDLVALEYDEHIPKPDPLANPDSVARSGTYGVNLTPAPFIDGAPLQVLGASRSDVENIVLGFADAIEDRAAEPSTLHLAVTASADGNHGVLARPALAFAPGPAAASPSMRVLARSTLHVALVQDNIRYSGENGIRFHRMVVRSVQDVPAAVYLSGSRDLPPVTFDLAAIQHKQAAYLDGYEKSNDRFGQFQFLLKDIPIRADQLGVAVWVQDPSTREVFQAAYIPVPAS